MTVSAANPLAERSNLPYQLPDFANLTAAHLREAAEAGMTGQLEALAALAADPEPATVENTLHAWERSSELLDRTIMAFYAIKASNTTDALDELYAELAPKLSAHSDAIYLDRALFDRATELATRAEAKEVTLDAEDAWALGEILRAFNRAGVALPDADQARLRQLNTRIAELSTAFEKANREGRVAGAVVVTDRAELDGLSDAEVAALETGEGEWTIQLVNTTQQPLLARLHHRGLRQRLFEASVARGLGGAHDTRALIVDIARARAEKAALLGYEHYAALIAEAGCAKTTDGVTRLMAPLGPAALTQAKADAEKLAAKLAELDPDATLAAWDWEYLADTVRRETFAFDESDVEEYLEVTKVLDAVYAAAHDLYGITFTRRADLVGHTPEAEVYEVHNADGSPVGLFVMDFWARPTKEGGAWMTSLVQQNHLTKQLPVVTNDCNYTPATTTITWDGVITMFHEFGHALHGLFADSRYASHSGPNTPRDFVEFPSQVNEHWAWEPGRVLPKEWIEKLKAASTFNQGAGTLELMAATLLDQSWHTTPLDALPAAAEEVEDFERRALERWGVAYDLVPPRYRSAYFSHIWTPGYAAAYYGYKWSEVMDADAVAWFDANGGGTRENGAWFREKLLAPGGSVDPIETYRSFRGRDPEVQPLLERLGLAGSTD
ncbi:M3 family metallopeptidase [Propioniciclava sp.]|uniref:M3 family metallopeptidase n=1 Tax=Propioniciclava sp. TaxID=2038686 RepID=UPI00263239D6|nr:M3 family metallopeptidase [Propioniciclava sp.]